MLCNSLYLAVHIESCAKLKLCNIDYVQQDMDFHSFLDLVSSVLLHIEMQANCQHRCIFENLPVIRMLPRRFNLLIKKDKILVTADICADYILIPDIIFFSLCNMHTVVFHNS